MSTTPTITVAVLDADTCEVEVALPAKYEVCSRCKGEGRILNPSIGQHAFGQEEWAEQDDDFKVEYLRGGAGIYGVDCPTCSGKRVELVIDRPRCTTPEQKSALRYLRAVAREIRLDDSIARLERLSEYGLEG